MQKNQHDAASILRNYFETGRLRSDLPEGLRNHIANYWDAPFLLNGYGLPCGTVRGVPRSAERIRHGSARSQKIPLVSEVYPAY